MFQDPNPRCANTACSSRYHWAGGGKLFRFTRQQAAAFEHKAVAQMPPNLHNVEHLWLCEECSRKLTLTCDPVRGVILRPLWSDPAAKEIDGHLTRA